MIPQQTTAAIHAEREADMRSFTKACVQTKNHQKKNKLTRITPR